jgi:hypothetical protein
MPECDAVCFPFNELPNGLDLGAELDRLYGGRYASLPYFQIYRKDGDVHVYAAYKNGSIDALFLYRSSSRRLIVLNEGISLDAAQAAAFAHHAFRRFPAVSAVSFRFVECGQAKPGLVHQRTAANTDMVLALPGKIDEYRASLGPNTRRNINNQLNKFARAFPGFRVNVYEKAAVPLEHVRGIIELQRGRMTDAGKVSMVDDLEEQRVSEYVARCGFVVTISLDGKLLAGTINYRLGRNFTARVVGHDPAYLKYHIGFLCAYLTICECIKAGGAGIFYFGWGHGAYKYRLGGIDRQLSHLNFYRSRAHALLHLGTMCKDGTLGLLCLARRWAVQAATRQDTIAGRALSALRGGLAKARALTVQATRTHS